jgi:N-acetylmuramoyl-L-alanine amidase
MNSSRYRRFALVLAVPFLVHGCLKPAKPPSASGETRPSEEDPAGDPMIRINTLIEAPPDYAISRIDSDEFPIPPYAKQLQGLKICLDPGHGGDAQQRAYKRGPHGVREAEVNLRVAQYLRDLLTYCEAQVMLTREGDTALSLEDRAGLAEAWNADLFISCHHNAVDDNPSANFTTVWYHGDVDFWPANLDLSRYLSEGLLDELGLDQVTGVPLKSDQLMYKSGFGLLRAARVTAALCESSFFSNPEEEERLREPEHNLREAYGMFIGLARYAAAGIPRGTLLAPPDAVVRRGQPALLEFGLDDGLRGRKSWGSERQMILSDSVTVRIDDRPLTARFVNEGYRLTVELPDDLAVGQHTVTVHFENMYKNSIINPRFTIRVVE